MNTKEYDSIELKIKAYELACYTVRNQDIHGYSYNVDALVGAGVSVDGLVEELKKQKATIIESPPTVMSEAKKIYEWLIAD